MATLKTNYKDDMFSGDRKYREIRNSDGTVSFEDVTVYSQEGDVFASADINATNTEVNTINASLTEKVAQHSDTTYSAVKGLGYDATGKKLGLVVSQGGADTVIPFSGAMTYTVITRLGGNFLFVVVEDGAIVLYTNGTSNKSDAILVNFDGSDDSTVGAWGYGRATFTAVQDLTYYWLPGNSTTVSTVNLDAGQSTGKMQFAPYISAGNCTGTMIFMPR